MLHSLLALLATLSQELGNSVWALRLCFIGFFWHLDVERALEKRVSHMERIRIEPNKA